MSVEVMDRRAADNRYLHRDFHNHLNLGINYLYTEYGAAALEEYLVKLANEFYAPVILEVKAHGLQAIKDAFKATYAAEDASEVLSFREKSDEMIISISECPAVKHLNETNTPVSEAYPLTTSIVWNEICRQAGIGYSMLYYLPDTGAAAHLFYTREVSK